MQISLLNLRHAVRSFGRNRIAMIATLIVLLSMSGGVRTVNAADESAAGFVAETASGTVTLHPAVYCSSARKNDHTSSLRLFLSELLGFDEGAGQISMPRMHSMGAVSMILLEDLGLSSATRRLLSATGDHLRGRIAFLMHADLRPHAWTSQNGSGRDILVTWMDSTVLRVKTQKTKISPSATQYSVSLAIPTGDAKRPWATFGFQAAGGSHDNAEDQGGMLTGIDAADDLLATEVTVTTVLPSAGDQAYMASWSSKRITNGNPLCTRNPVSRMSACNQFAG